MKRFLFSMLLAVLLFGICSFTAFAASEYEPNDTKENANYIYLDTGVAGNLSQSSDTDWFMFLMPTDGYITVDLEHETIPSTSFYWRMYIYQYDGVTNVLDYNGYWVFAGNDNGTTSQIGLAAGTYYIRIQYEPYNHSDVTYTLRVNYTPTAYTELEPNSSAKKSTEIAVNADYEGALASTPDEDWFEFRLPTDGYISIDFLHEIISSTERFWTIDIYQSDGVTSVLDYNGHWTVSGNADGKTSQIGLRAGTYYIKIKYNPYDHSDVTYTLRVNFTESDLTEYEPNARVNNATAIDVNKEYMGALAGSDDVDWYRFTLPYNGYITVHFDHEIISSTEKFWQLHIYQTDGVTGVLDYDGYWTIAGNANSKTSQIGLPSGTYCIKVQYDPYDHSDIIYKMRIDYTESELTELEPNSAPSKATEINLNTDYYGAVAGSRDSDWFRFTLPSDAQVTLKFSHELLDSSSNYWNMYLYTSDGVTEVSRYSVAGSSNGVFDAGELDAGTYYVKITYCPYNESDATYTLNISEKHDCVGQWMTIKEPTCIDGGQREEICSVCGKLMKTEAVPAYGHIASDWTVGKEATCTETGVRYAHCERCSEEIQEITDILPHSYSEWNVISGSKVIPPIVKEQSCVQCGYVNTGRDWSYVWIPILAVVMIFVAFISLCRRGAARKRRKKTPIKKTAKQKRNSDVRIIYDDLPASPSKSTAEMATNTKPNTQVQRSYRENPTSPANRKTEKATTIKPSTETKAVYKKDAGYPENH